MPGAKRYGATIVFAILAIVLAVGGALALTVWRPAQQLSASFQPEQPYVMVREGVLPLYADKVTVTAEAADPDQKVWIASGAGTDVSAWLYGHSFEIVTGTENATQLAIEGSDRSSQSGAAGQSADPQSGESARSLVVTEDEAQSGETSQSGEEELSPIASDMWSSIKEGTGSASVVVSGEGLTDVLLLSGDGEAPLASVKLTWPTPTPNLLAWILFPLAGLFALAAIVAAVVTARKARNQAQESTGSEDSLDILEEGVVVEDGETRSVDETVVSATPRPQSEFQPTEAVASEEDSSEEDSTADDTPEGLDSEADVEDTDSAKQSDLDDRKTVTVTTESGMMNLSAVSGGGQFPTRRALREARSKGVENLVVGTRSFATIGEQSPATDADESAEDTPTVAVPPNLRWRSKRGAERFGQGGDSE